MSPIIEFRDVSKVFASPSGPIRAVDGVDLTIEAGEIFGVIGYSGAGKSTLVRLINGLERVTSGQLIVDGDDVATLTERQLELKRREIGMIFQQFNLFSSRTVAGNVAFPLKVAGWPKADRDRRIAELLDFVGLLDRAHSYPDQLSGGQKQRVGIARALAASPKILLADESTSALDPQTTGEVLDLLKRVNADYGVTILLVTHEIDVIREIADKVAVMDDGRVVEHGSVYEVFSNPQNRTSRRFVSSVLHHIPSAETLDKIREVHHGRIVQIHVENRESNEPFLSRVARTHGVDFNVVYGGIDELQSRLFGSLTVELLGSDAAVDAAIADLRATTPVQEVAHA